MAAAPGGGNAGEGGGTPPHLSSAELVRRWEYVFDKLGNDKAMEVFMALLLRDARAEHARKARKEDEEERRARVFEPWQPPPPGSAPPPVTVAPPRVDRTVVLALAAPPHLLPRNHIHGKTKPASAADLGRSVKPAKNTRRGGVQQADRSA